MKSMDDTATHYNLANGHLEGRLIGDSKLVMARRVLTKLFEIYLIALFALLAGYNIIYETTDSEQYRGYYESISEEYVLGEYGFEPLFNLTASFSKLILGLDYNLFASLLMFIALYIKFFLFTRRANSALLKLAYLCTLYLMFECLTLRAAIAVSLGYLSFELRNKYWLAWFLLALSCLMHYSMILFVPILFFYKRLEDQKLLFRNLLYSTSTLFIGVAFITLLLSFNERFAGYILNNPEYFNIWGTPKIVILALLIAYGYANRARLSKDSCLLLYTGGITTIFGVMVFKYSLFSVRVVDIGILSYYLIISDKGFHYKQIGQILFVSLLVEQILMRSVDLPQIVLGLIR